MRTNDTYIGLLVSKDRWENMKNVVLRLQARVLEKSEVDLCTNYIISDRGTLGYRTQIYDPLTPYLKGFHITIYG